MKTLTTPHGVRIGIAGSKRPHPAPTLLVFATSIEETLTRSTVFNETGRVLLRRGLICASVDVPCHGHDLLPGETGKMEEALWDWRRRIERGNALVPEFTSRVSSAIDYLISSGWADPDRIAACGTSRGGFMALHAAAADARVRCAVGLAPVTDLLALREFEGMDKNETVRSLALRNVAAKLKDKSIWIGIGNSDTRVSTDCSVELARTIIGESTGSGLRPMVDLHVFSIKGHALHTAARKEAAGWIANAMGV